MYPGPAGRLGGAAVYPHSGDDRLPDPGGAGARYTDRLVALNLICTVVVLMVCILSYVLGASYLVDVAILYGLLNLLAVAVLSRISVRRHRERQRRKKS